jgi:hypothetical protein
MSGTMKKSSKTCLSLKTTCIDGDNLSLVQVFQANQGKPLQGRAFVECYFATLANDLLQREVSKCKAR